MPRAWRVHGVDRVWPETRPDEGLERPQDPSLSSLPALLFCRPSHPHGWGRASAFAFKLR